MKKMLIYALEILNTQLDSLDIKIIIRFQTDVAFTLKLLDKNNKVLFNCKYLNQILSYELCIILLIKFLSQITSIIDDKIKEKDILHKESEKVIVFECDTDLNQSSIDFKGIFSSKIKALIEIQKQYKTIIVEINKGQFLDFSLLLKIEPKFEKILIKAFSNQI